MLVKRLFIFIDRYFLHRGLPHGIISWQYLRPLPPPKVRLHRQLWLLNRPSRLPVFLFFLIEFTLWLRWVSFVCWRRCWRTVQHRGATISEREGIGKAAQLRQVLSLSLCHCLPPAEIYAFGLYGRKPREELWDYVYTHELPAFHHWRSARLGESQESTALLQDKLRLTDLLGPQGIPMVPVLGLLPRGAPFDPDPYLRGCPRLFCKPRHGSGSRDAFVIEGQSPGAKAAIFAVKGGMIAGPSTAESLQKALARDDFLVQPFMDNHAVLAALCPTKDAVTLRLITEIHSLHGPALGCATLEIPNAFDGAGYFHVILPMDLSSGRVMPFPGHRLPADIQSRYDDLLARMGETTIPCWGEVKRYADIAHQRFSDIYAIAWDFVITPAGPYMLEGNTGWGAALPQMIFGGLLQDETGRSKGDPRPLSCPAAGL